MPFIWCAFIIYLPSRLKKWISKYISYGSSDSQLKVRKDLCQRLNCKLLPLRWTWNILMSFLSTEQGVEISISLKLLFLKLWGENYTIVYFYNCNFSSACICKPPYILIFQLFKLLSMNTKVNFQLSLKRANHNMYDTEFFISIGFYKCN